MTEIHSTAIIHPKVKLGKNVKIGPYAVINSPDVVLEEGVEIKAHAYLDGFVHIMKNTTIFPFVSIGSPPQDKSYQGEKTRIQIGENCQIRDYVSINSSCGEGEEVTIGNSCFIMAYCHIAHNCKLGNHVTMANGATLGGHVIVGDYVNLGGLCAIHQNCRIGEYAMVGGGSMASRDIPPFILGNGYPIELAGINLIGLKRNGVPFESRKTISKAYRLTLKSGLTWEAARAEILATNEMNPFLEKWIEFCNQSQRGLAPARMKSHKKITQSEKLKCPELVELG